MNVNKSIKNYCD